MLQAMQMYCSKSQTYKRPGSLKLLSCAHDVWSTNCSGISYNLYCHLWDRGILQHRKLHPPPSRKHLVLSVRWCPRLQLHPQLAYIFLLRGQKVHNVSVFLSRPVTHDELPLGGELVQFGADSNYYSNCARSKKILLFCLLLVQLLFFC